MDVSILVSAATGLLAPYLRQGAEALAETLKDDLKEAVPKAAKGIYELVKGLFSSKEDQEVLEDAGTGDDESMNELADLLKQALKFNPAFKQQIEQQLTTLQQEAKLPLDEILKKVGNVTTTTTTTKINKAQNVNINRGNFNQGDGSNLSNG